MADDTSETSNVSDLAPVPHRVAHMHGVPILQTDLYPEERLYWERYLTETYFNTASKHRSALTAHVALYVALFVLLYPLVLVLWNVHHRLYFPALTVHTVLVCVSVANFWVFAASISDLYPHNAFSAMTGILFVGTLAHWGCALLAVAYQWYDHSDYFAVEDEDLNSMHSPDLTLRGSGFGSFELDDLELPDGHLQTSNGSMFDSRPSRVAGILEKLPALERASKVCGKTAVAVTGVVNWLVFVYFLVYFPTGIATYCVYGTDGTMFNLLAHFIKGGIFFILGLVTLARYCGAFRNKGWAWNHRFVLARSVTTRALRWQPQGLWTMEFVESAVIAFYGYTNVFLEHLASSNGVWTAKDLQHVAIAVIYLGCGTCGLFVEYKLNLWRYETAVDHLSPEHKNETAVAKASPGYSPNPFPIITIYWTGALMSKHEQASHLSTSIHVQWGNLFMVACVFRLLTYALCMVLPTRKTLTKPMSPMTELVVSFALLAGGMIFMESTDPVVHLFEYHGYTAMFTLSISLGLVALLMAWEMGVFAIKDCLLRRRARGMH